MNEIATIKKCKKRKRQLNSIATSNFAVLKNLPKKVILIRVKRNKYLDI